MTQDLATEYPPLAPVLRVSDARRALQCYSEAFGAVELYHLVDPATGRWAHLELRLPDGPLILLEERSDSVPGGVPDGSRPPGVRLCLFVSNVDALVARCCLAGLEVLQPPKTHFHGHRCALLRDPDGHEWMLSQAVEVLKPSEMQARWDRRRSTMPGATDGASPSGTASGH